ncbi:MAG: glycosyltransferase family 39 protein [Deltaproteobacteria bacterium]|nr:glycosyltransferase family 39 protein [Deltaproteobacteria bacterium]MBI3391497.1 glycosyltransferase family 39 protein [Deltaproteobacteria bacterium]
MGNAAAEPHGWREWLDWRAWLVAGLGAVYFASFVPYGYNLGEDGDVVYLIYRTFSGHRPYLDFGSGYTPGFFYFNALLLQLFGANILVLRWGLVVVNTLTLFGLYRLARTLMPPLFAALAPLAFAALLPVFPGEFATFNIPYPAWYVVLTWVASTLALMRCVRSGAARWALWAGVLAGIGCAFKPNTGAFNLAALGLTLVWLSAANGSRWQRLLWWTLLVGVTAAIAAVFGFRLVNRDARLLLWPVFALVVVRAMTARRKIPQALDSAAFPAAALALLGGFLAVTLPWMLYYLAQLGTAAFMRQVLFIGSGHELFFYIPIRALDFGDAAMLGAAGAALVGGWAIRRSRIAPARISAAALVIALAAVATVLAIAPMPEGPWLAFMQRWQHVSFGVALLVHWAGVVVAAGTITNTTDPTVDRRGRLGLVALAIGAPLLYLSIYPRSDYFHWVLTAPLTLMLGSWCYWRLARLWLGSTRWAMAAALPVYTMIVALAAPNVVVAWRLQTSNPSALAQLDLARAPIVLERGRRERLRTLQQTVEFIQHATRPEDTLLGFPNLHFINFLSGRHTPARYGHFHPGWPDHIVEAQIINAVQARRTPLIAFGDVQLFIGHAPLYYFLLRTYVQQHYQPIARFGRFDLLRRRGMDGESDMATVTEAMRGDALPAETMHGNAIQEMDCAAAVAWAEAEMPDSGTALTPCWHEVNDGALQGRALVAARATRDADTGRQLAEALRDGTLAGRVALLAIRTIGELADATALPPLIVARERLDGRPRDELDTALFNITLRAVIGAYLFVPNDLGATAVRDDPHAGTAALAWIASDNDRLRLVGAWIAGVRGESAAADDLRRLIAEDELGLQLVAGDALVRLGVRDGVVEPLLRGLTHDEMFLPSVVLAWSRAHPDAARVRLAETFRTGNDKQRETIAFIAAALGDAAYEVVLRPGLSDAAPRVRCACAWSLGYLGVTGARADLARVAADDPSEQVREFARDALTWLEQGRP